MKKQVLTLIIGILIGSIITTGVFLVLKKNSLSNIPNFDNSSFRERMQNGEGLRSGGERNNEEIQEEQNN